jgi:hypothetical protein
LAIWFKAPFQHPYPAPEEVRILKDATHLDERQIETCLGNTRKRSGHHRTDPTRNAAAAQPLARASSASAAQPNPAPERASEADHDQLADQEADG